MDSLSPIHIEAIPHKGQVYDTVGDWREDQNGVMQVRVSRMGDWRYEYLIALHEFHESFLCKLRGIREEDVTAWDLAHPDSDDPGSEPGCPYGREHFSATNLERIAASDMGVDWNEYDAAVANCE